MVNISEGYYDGSEEAIVHDVTFEKGIYKEAIKFKKVRNIKRPKGCKFGCCEYYLDCWDDYNGIIDITHCKKFETKILSIIGIIAGIIFIITWLSLINSIIEPVSIIMIFVLALLPFIFIVLDILMILIIKKKLLPIIFEKYLFKKLTKNEGKENENVEKTALEIQNEKIIVAERLIEKLSAISKKQNFGANNKKIKKCIQILNTIVKEIKRKPYKYSKVESIFRIYLPEFYKILKYYAKLSKVSIEKKKYKTTITKAVDNFLKLLKSKEEKIFIDKDFTEMQLESTTEALIAKMKMNNYD